MPTIADLPDTFPMPDGTTLDLRAAPAGPRVMTDLNDGVWATWRAAWQRWAEGVQLYRVERLRLIDPTSPAYDPAIVALEYQRCGADPAYFATVYCCIYEPRGAGDLPLLLYPFQIDLLRWFEWVMTQKGATADGVVSKSRDMGATWLVCVWVLWRWLFTKPFIAKLVSRAAGLVDAKDHPDAMLPKIMFQLELLPAFLLPVGLDLTEHKAQMILRHPNKRNWILGEATTQYTGRASRATVLFLDEAAFGRGMGEAWGGMGAVTDHRFAISTESLENDDFFYRLRRTKEEYAPAAVFAIEWWFHPLRDAQWFIDERARYQADGKLADFEREYERNPHAGHGIFWYPQARDLAAGDFGWTPGMPVRVGMDPGFDDETALGIFAYDPASDRYRLVDAYVDAGRPPEFYASLLTGVESRDGDEMTFDYRPNGIFDPREFMETIRLIRAKTEPEFYGDPDGAQRRTDRRDSWYDRIYLWSFDHAPEGVDPADFAVIFQVGWEKDQRIFSGRRAATTWLLGHLDVNDTPPCRYVLRALVESKYEEKDRDRIVEQTKPRHNWASHPRSMVEYVAVNLERFGAGGGAEFDDAPVRAPRPGENPIADLAGTQRLMVA